MVPAQAVADRRTRRPTRSAPSWSTSFFPSGAFSLSSSASRSRPFGRLLGFVLKVIEPGHAVFEMEVDERHHNPMGTLHGGVYCDLADAAMGYAYAATLAEGETFTTVELKINFLRAVRQGRLTAEAKVVKAGSALGFVECGVTDQARQVGGTGGEYLHETAGGSSDYEIASGPLLRWRNRWQVNDDGGCWPMRPCWPGPSWLVFSFMAVLECSAQEVIR